MRTDHGEIEASGDTTGGYLALVGLTPKQAAKTVVLTKLLVDPDARGKGHGSKMLTDFLAEMKRLGNKYVMLQAWPIDDDGATYEEGDDEFTKNSARLIKFYERHGFVMKYADEYYMLRKL